MRKILNGFSIKIGIIPTHLTLPIVKQTHKTKLLFFIRFRLVKTPTDKIILSPINF